jgi:hypothetical protein
MLHRSATRRFAGGVLATIVTALLCLLLSTPASAHDLPIERSLVLQIHTSHAELLLVYTEPPGPRTDRLLALHDANRNGKIDGVEGTLAKRPMLRRAFLGLDLSFPNVNTAKKEPQIRYRRDRSGGIAVAIYQRIDFVHSANELDVLVELEDAKGVPALDLVVELAGRWKFSEAKGDEVKMKLGSGAKKTFHLTRESPPVNKTTPDRDWQPPESTRP